MHIPCDIPRSKRKTYIRNYETATQGSGKLMLFAGDQRFEHLNGDFAGKGIHEDDADPEHFFRIASKARIGAFATQMGLISKYGADYPSIPYIIKLNSKTNLIPTEQMDPYSVMLQDVDQVVQFKKTSKLNIVGVGLTVYLGSEFEATLLRQAAQTILEAHQNGLLVVLWMYPRGAAIKDEKSPEIIAGACGVASCLGADFVKINYPQVKGKPSKKGYQAALKAAGRTQVICAGGKSTNVKTFLSTLKDQLAMGAGGNATGRNIHQKGLKEAVKFCNAISAITMDNKSVAQAMKIYK